MLMFMVIMLAAQPMIETVMEERSQRIAEVLLGSVSPSQLMAGKLLGCVAGSLTIVLVYGLGALGLAQLLRGAPPGAAGNRALVPGLPGAWPCCCSVRSSWRWGPA